MSGLSSFSDASSYCEQNNAGKLATFTTNGELSTVSSYVSALGSNGDHYWIGYSYDGAQLQDVDNNVAPAIVTNLLVNDNLAAETGTCIAVKTNGDFFRMSCTSTLGYVCLFTLTGGCGQQLTD